MQGKASFMTENVLPVVLAAYTMSFPPEVIQKALTSFVPNEQQAPGRLNLFYISGIKVIVDYAHNPHGLKAFSRLMNNIEERKTGIITGVGDRRDEDIVEVGKIAAEMYDDIIIRLDLDMRGRTQKEIVVVIIKRVRKKKEKDEEKKRNTQKKSKKNKKKKKQK